MPCVIFANHARRTEIGEADLIASLSNDCAERGAEAVHADLGSLRDGLRSNGVHFFHVTAGIKFYRDGLKRNLELICAHGPNIVNIPAAEAAAQLIYLLGLASRPQSEMVRCVPPPPAWRLERQ